MKRMSNNDVREFIAQVNSANAQFAGGEVVMSQARLTMVAREISTGRASEVAKDVEIAALRAALYASTAHAASLNTTLDLVRAERDGYRAALMPFAVLAKTWATRGHKDSSPFGETLIKTCRPALAVLEAHGVEVKP